MYLGREGDQHGQYGQHLLILLQDLYRAHEDHVMVM